ARVCGAADAVIRRVEGSDMRRVAHFGPIPLVLPEVRRITEGSASGRAILECRAIHFHDVLDPDVARDYPDQDGSRGWRTTLAVPLVREGTAIGAIVIRRTEVRAFTEKQIALLQTFADQAVIAIENVRLFKELQARNRDLTEALGQQTATSEILGVISSSPTDVQPVFETIARNAGRLCDAVLPAVFRVEGGLLHVVAGPGSPESREWLQRAFPRPIGSGATSWAMSERRIVQVPDTEAIGVAPFTREAGRMVGFRSQLVAPMLRDGTPIGAISVSRR